MLRASADWRLTRTDKNPSPEVLERAVFAHRSGRRELIAQVYRGSAIKACITAFFAALASDEPRQQTPLVAYLGHNGLMDFPLPAEATARRGPGRQAIVLCCASAEYFTPHLEKVGATPLLTTTQLMYPGGFLLRAAVVTVPSACRVAPLLIVTAPATSPRARSSFTLRVPPLITVPPV